MRGHRGSIQAVGIALASALISAAVAGCGGSSSPSPEAVGSTARPSASVSADATALPAAMSGMPTPPSGDDYDLSDPDDLKKYTAAMKAWLASLTPEQKAQLSASAASAMPSMSAKEKADLDWLKNTPKEVKDACFTLPFTVLQIGSLGLRGTGGGNAMTPKLVLAIVASIEKARDIVTQEDLRTALDTLAATLRRHAHDQPQMSPDPQMTKSLRAVKSWVSAHCQSGASTG